MTVRFANIGIAVCLIAMAACPAGAGDTYVLFTIDVETAAGTPQADVLGQLPDGSRGGIEKMMDLFDRHGVKATFFMNVYESAKYGPETMRTAAQTIGRRGHDPELHTHPLPMFPYSILSKADLAAQGRILQTGKELLEGWTGEKVVAHRAGCYAANADTLAACRQAGIDVEMSWNSASPECSLAAGSLMNAPFVRDGVLCVPVTSYIQAQAGSWRSLRFADVESSTPAEIGKILADLRRQDVRTLVIMMHSFSFTRNGRYQPRAAEALETMLDVVQATPGARVVTARQLHAIWQADPKALTGGECVPQTGWLLLYQRAWLRLDEGWKNIVVALAPPVLTAAVLVLFVGRLRRRRKKAA